MTLQQLERFRAQLQQEYEMVMSRQPEPGKESVNLMNGIEILAGLRTTDALITQERVNLAAPPGAIGPTL